MKPESIRRVRIAMQNAKGDDLERAQNAFRNLSETELDLQYGQSGRTCRQILEEYKRSRAEWKTSWDELNAALGGVL